MIDIQLGATRQRLDQQKICINIVIVKSVGKKKCWRPRRRWEGDIKVDFKVCEID
jgi:hypothetical protein